MDAIDLPSALLCKGSAWLNERLYESVFSKEHLMVAN
jgi:hypothetical protein